MFERSTIATADITTRPPLSESLQSYEAALTIWPDEMETSSGLTLQIAQHAGRIASINTLIDGVAGEATNVDDALRLNRLEEAEVIAAYEAISDLLSTPEYQRLALYLPVEVLPNDSLASENEQLRLASERLYTTYRASFEILLTCHDVAANFVDGDVVEAGYEIDEPVRTVQITQLIPEFLQRGLLQADDIKRILAETTDSLLSQSILEAFIGRQHTVAAAMYTSPARRAWLNERVRPIEPADKPADLHAPWSENIKHMSSDIARLKYIASAIGTNKRVADTLYPVVTVGGSKLKGYGNESSDVDVCVFVRPDVPYDERDAVYDAIDEQFGPYAPIAVWLKRTTDGLVILDKTEDRHAADSFWSHIVFGMAWIGASQDVRRVQTTLAAYYFNEPDLRTRQLHLERLEQDALQYRLLHKGYARHNTVTRESVFLDPGYRRLATKLYARSVFIPSTVSK